MDRSAKRQRISEPFRHSQLHVYNRDHYNYNGHAADDVDDSASSVTENDEEETTYDDTEFDTDGDEILNEYEEEQEEEDGDIYSADEDVEDEDATLTHLRAQVSQKLKSRFESIFEKYSKDFSDIGDEIDLETGEIVVNNGHLVDMQDETDAGNLGEGKGILRAFTVEPADQYVETDDANEFPPNKEQPCVQVVDSEEDEDEDEMIVDESESSSVVGEARATVENQAHTVDPNGKKSCPTNAEILEQFGPELGPEIIKVVSKRHAGGSYVEPAWRIPDSALAPIPPRKRPELVVSLPSLDISTEERSPSPIGGKSIWAPETGPGRPKKYQISRRKTSRDNWVKHAPYPRCKPVSRASRIPDNSSPKQIPDQYRKRHSTGSMVSHSEHPRSTARLGYPVLDTFENGIGQVLGESSQNLQPSLISNSLSFKLRPRGPVRRDPDSISWAEAVAAVQEVDPHLYEGLVEDAKRGRYNRRARSYSVDSTSSFGENMLSDEQRYPDEDVVPVNSYQTKDLKRKPEPSGSIMRVIKLTSSQLAKDAALKSILGRVKDPEQFIQYVGTTIEGTQHQVAAIPCPHIDCASRATTLYRCLCVGSEKSSQITSHLRDVHDTTPYACEEPGCYRRGGRGYFRSSDLAQHVRTYHPGIAAYDRLRPRISEDTFDLYDYYAAERTLEISSREQDQERRWASFSADQSRRKSGENSNQHLHGAPASSNVHLNSTNPVPTDTCYEDKDVAAVYEDSFNSDSTTNTVAISQGAVLSENIAKSSSISLVKNKSPAKVTKAPRNIRFLIPASDDDYSDLLSSAPVSQEHPSSNSSKAQSKEIFSRNKIDPAYEFSDEEPSQSHKNSVPQLKSPKTARFLNALEQMKQSGQSTNTDGAVSKQSDRRLIPTDDYIYPCRYRDTRGCKKMFRVKRLAQRHSKSHDAEDVFDCEYPGCSRWFTTYFSAWRHSNHDHYKKGKDFSERPEYLSEVEDEDINRTLNYNAAKAQLYDLPPPYSSPYVCGRAPNGQLIAEQNSLSTKINTSPPSVILDDSPDDVPGGNFEEISDNESSMVIEKLDNQQSRITESRSFDLPKQVHTPKIRETPPTQLTVQTTKIPPVVLPKQIHTPTTVETPPRTQPTVQTTKVPPVVSLSTATATSSSTVHTKSPTVLHQVPSQNEEKKEQPQKFTVTVPALSVVRQSNPTIPSMSIQSATSGIPTTSNKKAASQNVSPITKSPKDIMPPPPVPCRAKGTEETTRQLWTPQPKQATPMQKQAKEARKRSYLPIMDSHATSVHSTPLKKIHRSIEQLENNDFHNQTKEAPKRRSPTVTSHATFAYSTPLKKIRRSIEQLEVDDLDELDLSFDSPALMRVRAGSVASSSPAKKRLTPRHIVKNDLKDTPSTPQQHKLTPKSNQPLWSEKKTPKNARDGVRLSDMSGDVRAVQNRFTTPVKRKRSMLGVDDGKMDEDLVKTPGGTLRKCGEDGFSCERDFCFTCA